MLKQIKLTNFKRHESLTISFADGLTAIKGGNEAGKSTLIQAIAYALFGTKALPYSLEDTVTHGKPANTLKVVLDFVVDGVDYCITRSKGGAEIVYAGGTVTGQTETAAFIGRLLGTDAQAAPKLIMANQNDIRGALAAGPKATTELIEKLAEFDQLDKLIDLIQAKLVTGSTIAAETALASAQQQLDDLPTLEAPDADALAQAENDATLAVQGAQAAVSHATTKHREAVAMLSELEKSNADVLRAERNLLDAEARLETAKKAAADIKVPKAPNEKAKVAVIKALENALDDLRLQPILKAVTPFLNLTPEFKGSTKDLDFSIDKVRDAISAAKATRQQALSEIKVKEALMIAGACTLCGKDVSDVPEVVAKNLQLQADVEAMKEVAGKAAQQVVGLQSSEATYINIKSGARAALAIATKYSDIEELKVDNSQVPPRMTWKGPTDFAEAAAARDAAQSQLQVIEAKEKTYVAAKARAEEAARRVEAAENDLQYAKDQLAGRKVQDTQTEQALVQDAEAFVQTCRTDLDTARAHVEQVRSHRREAVAQWESHLKLRAQIEKAVAERTAEVKVLHFNNTLLKAVRTARPVIGDKLWALVLGAVSKYFSEMRGERSLVTKTSDGFVVDGHNAASLSGSTLDILGLAVRVALVRTFVPHAPLLVLDEPTAAMDADRTATTLGFLASTGFKQTIIVSHEEATEAVADNLIQL